MYYLKMLIPAIYKSLNHCEQMLLKVFLKTINRWGGFTNKNPLVQIKRAIL